MYNAIMKEDALQSLLKSLIDLPKENEWVEFKVDNSDPQKTGEIIAGLSNSANLHNQPFGFLVFGVNDSSHEIIGTTFKPRKEKKGNEDIQQWWVKLLKPRLDFQIFEFKSMEKDIVIFQIPAAIDIPTSFKRERFARIGSNNMNLKEFPEIERKIWANLKRKSFETQIALPGIDDNKVLELLDHQQYFILKRLPHPADSEGVLKRFEEDKLIIKSLGRYDITNMGAILFARDVTTFETIKRKAIRLIIYEGKNRIKTIKEIEGKKGYASGFQGLVGFINDQLPSNEEIHEALRIERKIYPEIAIRELVANALIHQDFHEKGNGPMIELFQDRIEINNPGCPLISIDRFIDHTPKSRNEDIASFMRRINICEERGSGIDKVISSVELFQLPAPKFERTDNSTRIILYSSKPLNKMDKSDKIRACYQHCCLKYVSNEQMTNTSLRKRFDIKDKNYSIASRIISDTIKESLIKPYESGRSRSKKHAKYVPFWA